MAQAVTEATLKTTKDELAAEKKNHKSLTKSFEEDKVLLEAKKKGSVLTTCIETINNYRVLPDHFCWLLV